MFLIHVELVVKSQVSVFAYNVTSSYLIKSPEIAENRKIRVRTLQTGDMHHRPLLISQVCHFVLAR